MRFLSKLALVALLALGLMNASHAQGLINPLLPVKGTKEVAFSGSFHLEPTPTSFNADVKYGPFLDDARLQVGVQLGYSHTSGSDFTSYGVFGNYHFPGPSQLLPYVGLQFGGASGGGSAFAYGAQGGVKYFINSSVAAFGELAYLHFDKDIADGKRNSLDLNFGLAIYLR